MDIGAIRSHALRSFPHKRSLRARVCWGVWRYLPRRDFGEKSKSGSRFSR